MMGSSGDHVDLVRDPEGTLTEIHSCSTTWRSPSQPAQQILTLSNASHLQFFTAQAYIAKLGSRGNSIVRPRFRGRVCIPRVPAFGSPGSGSRKAQGVMCCTKVNGIAKSWTPISRHTSIDLI